MDSHARKHIFHQHFLKCFLWFYWILDGSLFLLVVSLEVEIHLQSVQFAGTTDAGVATCVSRFSLLPVVAIVNPTVETEAVAVRCWISSRLNKPAGSLPFTDGRTLSSSAFRQQWTEQCRLMQPESGLGASQRSRWNVHRDFSSCVYLERQLEGLVPNPLWMVASHFGSWASEVVVTWSCCSPRGPRCVVKHWGICILGLSSWVV